MKTKIVAMVIIVSALVCMLILGVCALKNTDDNFARIEDKFVSDSGLKDFCIYDASELTAETLENRTNGNVVIVERCIGIVTNEYRFGDGKILNTDDEYYNYISYREVKGAEEGDIIVTYLIYNQNNNAVDDIVERYDYVLV